MTNRHPFASLKNIPKLLPLTFTVLVLALTPIALYRGKNELNA